MKMRIVKLIAGHGTNFPIGMVVDAEASKHMINRYSVQAPSPSGKLHLRVTGIAAECLEVIKS